MHARAHPKHVESFVEQPTTEADVQASPMRLESKVALEPEPSLKGVEAEPMESKMQLPVALPKRMEPASMESKMQPPPAFMRSRATSPRHNQREQEAVEENGEAE